MAKTSVIARSRKKPKFSSRIVRRCFRCGRKNGYMRMFDYMVMSPLSALRQFGVSKLAASVLQCVLSLVVIALIIAVWSRPLLRWQRVMLMASGGLLATPYALNYDLGFLTLAIVLYWTSVHETTQHLKIDRIFLAYLAPVLCIYLAIFLRPLTPLIILAVFWRTYKSCAKRIAIPNYLRPESA